MASLRFVYRKSTLKLGTVAVRILLENASFRQALKPVRTSKLTFPRVIWRHPAKHPLGFRVVLVTTASIHLPIHFALQSGGQKLPAPLDSPIIITKFPLSVNWFSSATAGYIFKGCAASCKKAAASLRMHLTDAVISGNVSKLGKSLTISPGSFSRRERFWNEWSRRGRQKRESNL